MSITNILCNINNTIKKKITFTIYKKNAIDIVRFLILSFSFLIISSIIKNYQNPYILTILLFLCFLLLAITIVNTLNGFLLLIFITPYFGNHPGGKYLEVFDMLLFLWISISLFRINNFKHLSFINGLEWLFLLSGLLSILINPPLLFDIIFSNTPTIFHVFSAVESNPLYSLKMFFATLFCITSVLIIYNLYLEKGIVIINKIFYAIAITLAITILGGVLEAHVPGIQIAFDKYHFYIDGYVDKAPPHTFGIISLLQRPYAVQSFFWNRGWYATFLIAALPFVSLMVINNIHDSVKLLRNKLFIGALYALLMFYILVLVAARGALLSFIISFIVFVIIYITNAKKILKTRFVIPGLLIVVIALIPLFNIYTATGLNLDTGRLEYYKAGIEVFKRHMFFGCGIEGYGIYNMKYLVPSGIGTLYCTTHNQLLQIASGQGLFGVTIYLSIMYYVIFSLIKSLHNKKQYMGPLLSGFIGVLIYSSFQEWYYLRSVQLFWWLLIMIIMLYCKNSPNDKSPLNTQITGLYDQPLGGV